MDNTQVNQGFQDYPGDENNQKKTRWEEAKENLPREKYEELKNKGYTDKKIMDELNIPSAYMNRLKKEWGLIGAQVAAGTQVENEDEGKVNDNTQELSGPQGEAEADQKMNALEAIELWEELSQEIDCVEQILSPPEDMKHDIELTPRVKELLEKHLAECGNMLNRLQDAFAEIEIEV